MAKKSKEAVEQARNTLRDTIGITTEQAQRWIAAHKAEQEARGKAQDHYSKQRNALRDKATELGRELTSEETIEVCKALPEPMTKAARKRINDEMEAAEKAIAPLRELFVIARHVSSSGMSRRLSLHVFRNGSPLQLSYNASIALGYRYRYHDRDSAVVMGGCGMDMGFALVYELSHALYGDGYLLKHRWL